VKKDVVQELQALVTCSGSSDERVNDRTTVGGAKLGRLACMTDSRLARGSWTSRKLEDREDSRVVMSSLESWRWEVLEEWKEQRTRYNCSK
jgi:hypothetical protein